MNKKDAALIDKAVSEALRLQRERIAAELRAGTCRRQCGCDTCLAFHTFADRLERESDG